MDREEENPDSSLRCIEEYYRKYSRDSNLHKYFSGTSMSYLPPLRLDDDTIDGREGPASIEKPDQTEKLEKDGDKSENVSIVSDKSELSEKKLEWDSGADIGYHNYNQFKRQIPASGFRSLSLPTLKDLQDTKITFPVTHVNLPLTKPKSLSTNTSSDSNRNSDKKTDVYLVSYSSSSLPTSSRHSSTISEIAETGNTMSSQSTSTENSNSNASSEHQSLKSKVAHLSETLNILKLAIGLPEAFSTPILPDKDKSSSPLKCSRSLRKQTLNKRSSRGKLAEKVISSSSSRNLVKKRSFKEKPTTKVVNLTLSTPVTMQCLVDQPVPIPKKQVLDQSHHKPSSQVSEEIKVQASDSDLDASHCESFEYFDGNSGVSLQSKPKLTDINNDKTANDTNVLSDDIDKAVSVIHQFFESRPLSYSKKRRYIKKIIHRIESKFQTRFLEDSSSNQTGSSGIHIPSQVKQKRAALLHTDKSYSDPGPSKLVGNVNEVLESRSLPDAKDIENVPPQDFIQVVSQLNSVKASTSSGNTSTGVSANDKDNPSDCVLNFVKNEKAYQISWINNEINHLTKLKKLLEHSEDPKHKKKINQKKLEVEKWQDVEKPVSSKLKTDEAKHNRNNISSKKLRKACYRLTSTSGESEEEKNFVIETRVNFDSHKKTIFQLDGKKYSVEDASSPQQITSEESNQCIIRDIEVETIESVTNIKISSPCENGKNLDRNCGACQISEQKSIEHEKWSRTEVTPSKHLQSDSSPYESSDALNAGCNKAVPESEEIQDYYDSLKKIFKSCQCIKGEKCRCIFVRNILRYFGNQSNILPKETQTETHCTNAKAQTLSNTEDVGVQLKHSTVTAGTSTIPFGKTGISQTFERAHKITATDQVLQSTISQGIQSTNRTENAATEAAIVPDCFCSSTQTKLIPRTERSNQVISDVKDLATQSNGVLNVPQSIQATFNQKDSATQAGDLPNSFGISTTTQAEISSTERSNQAGTGMENLAIQSNAALDTNQTQTNVPSLETGSQTKSLDTKTAGIQVYPNIRDCKSQFCSTSDLNPPPSYASEGTQTQVNLKSIVVEVGSFPVFNRETQTTFDSSSLSNRVRAKDQAQTAQASLVHKGVLTKENSVDESNQASTINKEVPSQVSPDVNSQNTQTRNRKYPEIHFKEPMSDRTNETSLSSNSTRFSSTNTTSTGECTYNSATLCICCKSSSDLGSLFCKSCRKKYNIHKRPKLRSSKDEKTNSYCSCSKTKYCKYCQLKLSKTSRSHGGLAYTLTLESFSSDVEPNSTIVATKKELEEIKMRVPKKVKHKSSKEKENYVKKSEVDLQKSKENDERTEKDTKGSYTLQEYLANNKPDFVNMADYRRLILTHSRMIREKKGDMAKFNFLEKNIEDEIPKKLFSNREMKEITRKHYNKLTKDRELVVKKAKLKQADKLIADIFSKKLQQQVLTGKRNFPIDKVLVSFS